MVQYTSKTTSQKWGYLKIRRRRGAMQHTIEHATSKTVANF
jgi:hypothetical protein